MPEPHLRAGDADRSVVAATLGRHMAAGRLTLDEYDERVARAYAAKTYGDLAELTTDLPAERPAARPGVPARAPAPRACGPAAGPWARSGSRYGRGAWASWLSTAVIVVGIWLITSMASGGPIHFWPIWVIGPWGAVLLARAVTGRSDRDRERRRQLRA